MQLEQSEIIELKAKSIAMNVVSQKILHKIEDFKELQKESKELLDEYYMLMEFNTNTHNFKFDFDRLLINYFNIITYLNISKKIYDDIITEKRHIDEYLEIALNGNIGG